MARPPYLWRQLNPEQRRELLASRRVQGRPWHSPPHLTGIERGHFHLAAACFEHRPHIGRHPQRMAAFSEDLLCAVADAEAELVAWCVLPNHYHLLVGTDDVAGLARALGRVHGRSSHAWNGEEEARGRTVFCHSTDRLIRSESHFWATLNYIHHNPVHHGYSENAPDWPWSSAADYLAAVGQAEADRVWRAHPVLDYGRGWDDPHL